MGSVWYVVATSLSLLYVVATSLSLLYVVATSLSLLYVVATSLPLLYMVATVLFLSRHFFELLRFDFVLDEELTVWLMEVGHM